MEARQPPRRLVFSHAPRMLRKLQEARAVADRSQDLQLLVPAPGADEPIGGSSNASQLRSLGLPPRSRGLRRVSQGPLHLSLDPSSPALRDAPQGDEARRPLGASAAQPSLPASAGSRRSLASAEAADLLLVARRPPLAGGLHQLCPRLLPRLPRPELAPRRCCACGWLTAEGPEVSFPSCEKAAGHQHQQLLQSSVLPVVAFLQCRAQTAHPMGSLPQPPLHP
mmetsp:Transcript_56060/g.99826  ORF Transcript_56060/g.99826 Transcript_56060/m.99826 type:complete len:224 (+) Transcript_56060:170-841(+)